MDLRQQLRDAIAASGHSLNQLGKSAHVSASQLSRFMRGQRDLNLEAAARLCHVLGLKLCRVLAGPAEAAPAKKRKGKGG
jgi:transcriptional regulator with XRE-family HTH domain